LISLPIFILKLFPRDFFNLLMKERESIPDEPLLTLRQKLNRGMLLGLILFPDSSVLKSKVLPNCLKRPRYVYSPPNATVNHLREFIIARASVEADFRAKDEFKVEFATVLCEKNEVNLRISPNTEDTPGLSNQQKGELVLKVKCGRSPFVNKKSSRRDTLIFLKHPFQALEKNTTVKSIATNSRVLGRPLKIVFRLVPLV